VVHDIVPERVAESAAVVRQHGRRVMEAIADVADPTAMSQPSLAGGGRVARGMRCRGAVHPVPSGDVW
jgi:hypothetical protein